MLIENQLITVKWFWNNRDHFESLGYKFTKNLDEFEVKAEELTKSSSYRVEVQCDYCNEVYETTYGNYLIGLKKIEKSCCNNTVCMKLKREESLMQTYHVSHAIHIPGVREKTEETLMKKYGVKSTFENEKIKEKIQKKILEKFGVENVFQDENIKKKIKRTLMERYGTTIPRLVGWGKK